MTRHVAQIASTLEMINNLGGIEGAKERYLTITTLAQDAEKAQMSWANEWKKFNHTVEASKSLVMSFAEGPGALLLKLIGGILKAGNKLDQQLGNEGSAGVMTWLTTIGGGYAAIKTMRNISMAKGIMGQGTQVLTGLQTAMNAIGASTGAGSPIEEIRKALQEAGVAGEEAAKKVGLFSKAWDLKRQGKGMEALGLIAKSTGFQLLALAAVTGTIMYLYKKHEANLVNYSEALNDVNKSLVKFNTLASQDSYETKLNSMIVNQINNWSMFKTSIDEAGYALQDVLSKVSDIKNVKPFVNVVEDKTGSSEVNRSALKSLAKTSDDFRTSMKDVYATQLAEYTEANSKALHEEYSKLKNKDQYSFSDYALESMVTSKSFNIGDFRKKTQQQAVEARIRQSEAALINIMKQIGTGSAGEVSKNYFTSALMGYQQKYKIGDPAALQKMNDNIAKAEENFAILAKETNIDVKTLKTAYAKSALNVNNRLIKPEETQVKTEMGMIDFSKGVVAATKEFEQLNKYLQISNLFEEKRNKLLNESLESILAFNSALNARVEFVRGEMGKVLSKDIAQLSKRGIQSVAYEGTEGKEYGLYLRQYYETAAQKFKNIGYDINQYDLDIEGIQDSIGKIETYRANIDEQFTSVLYALQQANAYGEKTKLNIDINASQKEILESIQKQTGLKNAETVALFTEQYKEIENGVMRNAFQGIKEANASYTSGKKLDFSSYFEAIEMTGNDMMGAYFEDLKKTGVKDSFLYSYLSGQKEVIDNQSLEKLEAVTRGKSEYEALNKDISNAIRKNILSTGKQAIIAFANAQGLSDEQVSAITDVFERAMLNPIIAILTQQGAETVMRHEIETLQKKARVAREMADMDLDLRKTSLDNQLELYRLERDYLLTVSPEDKTRMEILKLEMESQNLKQEEANIRKKMALTQNDLTKDGIKAYNEYSLSLATTEMKSIDNIKKQILAFQQLRNNIIDTNSKNITSVYQIYQDSLNASKAVYGNVAKDYYDIRNIAIKEQEAVVKQQTARYKYMSEMRDARSDAEKAGIQIKYNEELKQSEIDIFNARTELIAKEKSLLENSIKSSLDIASKVAKGEKLTIDSDAARSEFADAVSALVFGSEAERSPEIQLLDVQTQHLSSIDTNIASLLKLYDQYVKTTQPASVVKDIDAVSGKLKPSLNTENKKYELSNLKGLNDKQRDFANTIYNEIMTAKEAHPDLPVEEFFAQAMHETGWGKSAPEHNLFGMKKSSRSKRTQTLMTSEWLDKSNFRDEKDLGLVYQSNGQYYSPEKDKSGNIIEKNNKYLVKLPQEFSAFDSYGESIEDRYKHWSKYGTTSSYATDPQYMEKLNKIIENTEVKDIKLLPSQTIDVRIEEVDPSLIQKQEKTATLTTGSMTLKSNDKLIGNAMAVMKMFGSLGVILQDFANAQFAKEVEDLKKQFSDEQRELQKSINLSDTNAEKIRKETQMANLKANQQYELDVKQSENEIDNQLVAVNKMLLDKTATMVQYLSAIAENTAPQQVVTGGGIIKSSSPFATLGSLLTGTNRSLGTISGTVPGNTFSFGNAVGALSAIGSSGTGINVSTSPLLKGLVLSGISPSGYSAGGIIPSDYSGISYGGEIGNLFGTLTGTNAVDQGFSARDLAMLMSGGTDIVSAIASGDMLSGGLVSGMTKLGSFLTNEKVMNTILTKFGGSIPMSGEGLESLLGGIGGGLSALGGGFQIGSMLGNGKFDAGGAINAAISLGMGANALAGTGFAGSIGGALGLSAGGLGAGAAAAGVVALPALALGFAASKNAKRTAKYRAAQKRNEELRKYQEDQIQKQLEALKGEQIGLTQGVASQNLQVGQAEALRRSMMNASLSATATELYRDRQVSKRGGAFGTGRKRKTWVMEAVSATANLGDFGYSTISGIEDTYQLMNNITKRINELNDTLSGRGQHEGSVGQRKEWAENKAMLEASKMLYEQIKGVQEAVVKSTTALTQNFFGFETIALNAEGVAAKEGEAVKSYDIGAWSKREDLLNSFVTNFLEAGHTVGQTIAGVFVEGTTNAFIKNNSALNNIIKKIEDQFKDIGKKFINTKQLITAAQHELTSGSNKKEVYENILSQLEGAGYGNSEMYQQAQQYLKDKNYKDFVTYLQEIINTGNTTSAPIKDLVSSIEDLKNIQKDLEEQMRSFIDDWLEGGGKLSDIVANMDNLLSRSANILTDLAVGGNATEAFEGFKTLVTDKILPVIKSSVMDSLTDTIVGFEKYTKDLQDVLLGGKLNSGFTSDYVDKIGNLFDALENPLGDLSGSLDLLGPDALQKILAYKNLMDEINEALYDRMTIEEKISYNQNKLSEEISKYKTQIIKQGGVIDIGIYGNMSFKELEKQLQNLLAAGKEIPEELKKAIELANGQYGDLNQTIIKLEKDMKQAASATKSFTTAWFTGLISGDYETIKSELSSETQGMMDEIINSFSAEDWETGGTSIGQNMAQSVLNAYANKLINSNEIKGMAGTLNQLLFDNLNFVDENGMLNFDMLYQLSQQNQKLAVESEINRQRFEAVNSMFDYTKDIRYSSLEKEIDYQTSSTRESIYNITNNNTFQIGNLVSTSGDLTMFANALAPYLIEVFKNYGAIK